MLNYDSTSLTQQPQQNANTKPRTAYNSSHSRDTSVCAFVFAAYTRYMRYLLFISKQTHVWNSDVVACGACTVRKLCFLAISAMCVYVCMWYGYVSAYAVYKRKTDTKHTSSTPTLFCMDILIWKPMKTNNNNTSKNSACQWTQAKLMCEPRLYLIYVYSQIMRKIGTSHGLFGWLCMCVCAYVNWI